MNQQRSRRFRSVQEDREKDEDKEELIKMLQQQNGGVLKEEALDRMQKRTWDKNAITPGTPFMVMLAACLRYWCAYKVNTDPGWEKVKIIISDASVPGEGEHKIMDFIRSQRSSPEHNPNTRHVIYGLDADLIMLGLATHEPHFRVLREDVFFQESKARTCRICGQKGHIADECKGEAKKKEGEFDEKDNAVTQKPFIWLHVSVLREYLQAEMHVPEQSFRFDLERALDDWVFMCFFVGNDFLPHLPSLDIRENGIDTLIAIWRDNLPLMGGYLTKDGHVDLARCQFILNGLAKQEDAIFRRRRQTEERKDANAKRRKLEEQNRNSKRNGNRHSNGNGTTNPVSRRGSPDYSAATRQNDDRNPPPGLPLFAPTKGELPRDIKAMTHEMAVNRGAIYKANLANKSAAAALKSQLLNRTAESGDTENHDSPGIPVAEPDTTVDSIATPETRLSALGKRKAELMEDDDSGTPGRNTPDSKGAAKLDNDEPSSDNVRLWEEGYADRYYEQKFGADPKDIAFRNKVAAAYVEGLAWVLLYYLQGCPSWTWFYPYHYAPFAADFVGLAEMKITFERGKPFKPYEQLMGVMPAGSAHTIPEPFRSLMTDDDSEIIDFYPEDFPVDLNGKKWAWQGVVVLPFIDGKRLLDAMAKRYPQLTADEVARNELGNDVLIMSDRHPLYVEVASNFYSKRQGAPKYKLNSKVSEGLAGKVGKDPEYLPASPLVFPIENVDMPTLEEDHSIMYVSELLLSHFPKPVIMTNILVSTMKCPDPNTSTSRCSSGASNSLLPRSIEPTSKQPKVVPGTRVAPSAVHPFTGTTATIMATGAVITVISTTGPTRDQTPLPLSCNQARARRRRVVDSTKGVRLHRQQADGGPPMVRSITRALHRRIMEMATNRGTRLLHLFHRRGRVMRRLDGMQGMRRRRLMVVMVVGDRVDGVVADVVIIGNWGGLCRDLRFRTAIMATGPYRYLAEINVMRMLLNVFWLAGTYLM